jgi:hypothetical protein
MTRITSIILIALSLMTVVSFGCKKGLPVDCATKLRDVDIKNKDVGAWFLIKCPANCAQGTAWGTDVYTYDSSLCMAAAHAGVITKEKGGTVKVIVVKGLDKYSGSERNGVKSNDWKIPWGETAFQVK